MKVRALRGVCIGPGRNLAEGDTADLDASTTQFLISIRAVERVPDEPQAPAAVDAQPETQAPPKGGKKEK